MIKNKGLFTGLIVAAGLLTAAGSASAKTAAQTRIHNQHARIRQGVRSGELSPWEARRLRQHERMIRKEVRRAHLHGVTPKAQAKLQHRLNLQSKRIHELKHNKTTNR